MRIRIFADCADIREMKRIAAEMMISGFTTNPTLMRRAGVTDFEKFGREVLALFPFVPVSLEVTADEPVAMYEQAMKIASWGKMAYVKIPVVTPKGMSCIPLIGGLGASGVRLNITAVMTLDQVSLVASALKPNLPTIVSVFAGRIADTGVNPVEFMRSAGAILRDIRPEAMLLWASPREVYNLYQAEKIGCDIITMSPDLIAKLHLHNKDLEEYSLETVQGFDTDAKAAGYTF